MWGAVTAVLALAAVTVVGVGPASASARNGSFYCNAVAGRLGPGYEGNSNPAGSPCQDDSTFVKSGQLGPAITIIGATSFTDQNPDDLSSTSPAAGDSATAFASAATIVIRIGAVTIAATAVSSTASATCAGTRSLSPVLSSSSQVVGLSVNGGPARIVTGYTKINVLGLVVLELNKTTLTFHKRMQQALVVSSALATGKLVVGEATAGYSGNPCRSQLT